MADETPAEKQFSRRVRLTFAWAALAYCGGLIAYLTLAGKPENSLHQSGLSWAFLVTGGVLAGIGFGAVAPLLQSLKK